ncbi:MAG: hypothetical protein KBS74_06585 [Clostridiales bacterium]|nr:hypothetical protein [Candidatus Cacconaster stercorequi]
MYNRYIRNDNGSYARMTQDDPSRNPPPQAKQSPPPQAKQSPPPPPPPPPPPASSQSGETLQSKYRTPESRFFNRLLDKVHLGDIDSGDLLLLLILFLLFQENADEELLIAIGLLLIL